MDLSRKENRPDGFVLVDSIGGANQGRPQFSIPDLLQLYRQTLYMAVKEADLATVGHQFEESGLAEIRADLDNWSNIQFDPPHCLRLSKKSGACQKIVSYWKKLLGSILTDRDPSSFGNHDRGVMTICKLLYKDFQIAVAAITKWNDRDFPSIPSDQAKEKLSMNQLTFLCRRYHHDLTLIAHAFKASITTNDFKYLNPRLTETYPIDEGPGYEPKEEITSPSVAPVKPLDKRKRPSQVKQERHSTRGDPLGLSMASSLYSDQDTEPHLAQFSDTLHNSPLPSPIDPSKAFFLQSQHRKYPVSQSPQQSSDNHSILKSLLPRNNGERERERDYSDQPLNLGQARVTSQSNGKSHTNNGPIRRDGHNREAHELENQKLREKTKRYVGMIMTLVQQIVGSGQVPFIDLRCIDPEDRADMSSGPKSLNSSDLSIQAQNGRSSSSHHNSPSYKPNYNAPRTSDAPIAAPVRRKPPTRPSSGVSFDQSTLRWHGGPSTTNGSSQSRRTPDPVPRRTLPVASTLSSLLSEPVLGQYNPNKYFSVIQHSNNGSPVDSSSCVGTSKSKRKNNPVKRELPGYAPHVVSSPDGAGSDDAVSTGSGEHLKSVKASVFVPPVETTYVESRGVNGGMKRSSPDELSRQVVPSRNGGHAANKRKCSLQTMADSLLFDNGGLSRLDPMPEALPTEVPDSVSGNWMTPGTLVFARMREDERGMLWPGEILEKAPTGYVVGWLHENSSAAVPVMDIFQLDEVFTDKRAVMVKMHDGLETDLEDGNYQLATFMDDNGDGTYNVYTNGRHIRCHLADLLIVMSQDRAPLSLEGSTGCYTHDDAISSRSRGSPGHSDYEPIRVTRSISSKAMSHSDSNEIFRDICFLITGQMTSMLKGCDDQHVTALIKSGGGIIVKQFEDLITSGRRDKILLAPSACSTPEFFQCLAANIPCVSYQWILDCNSARTKLSYEDSLLPAGIEKDEVVFWQVRDCMFGKRHIGFCSESGEFMDSNLETWLLALKTGGVSVTAVDPDHITKEHLANLDIVVVDGVCPGSLRNSSVSVVNEKWLKSSLIHGKIRDLKEEEFVPHFN